MSNWSQTNKWYILSAGGLGNADKFEPNISIFYRTFHLVMCSIRSG
jgi:hypothetical protein